jgi:hypothetical protein
MGAHHTATALMAGIEDRAVLVGDGIAIRPGGGPFRHPDSDERRHQRLKHFHYGIPPFVLGTAVVSAVDPVDPVSPVALSVSLFFSSRWKT